MIIFKNEDRAYMSWVRRHRDGFVLDVLKDRGRNKAVLHRATCEDICATTAKRTYWTTGRRAKAYSDRREELISWSRERAGEEPKRCSHCDPDVAAPAVTTERQYASRLSKLGRDILSYVLETSVLSLDNPDVPYVLTAEDLARYVDKSLRQIAGTILSLVANNWLRLRTDTIGATEPPVRPSALVLPTAKTLRTLPAFAELTDEEIEAELDSLEAEVANGV